MKKFPEENKQHVPNDNSKNLIETPAKEPEAKQEQTIEPQQDKITDFHPDINIIPKNDHTEKFIRARKYKQYLDEQMKLINEKKTYELNIRNRTREIAVLRSVELEQQQKQKAMQERRLKEITKKTYDEQIAEQRKLYDYAKRIGSISVSIRNPREGKMEFNKPIANEEKVHPPFFLQDLNLKRYKEVQIYFKYIYGFNYNRD